MTTKVDNIINAYANDLEGLTREECLKEDFSARQCDVLQRALSEITHPLGPQSSHEGIISPEERARLEAVGFSKKFIQGVAGDDGKKALFARARWLADNINKTFWPFGPDVVQRRSMIYELDFIGPDAKAFMPELIKALDDDIKIRTAAIWTLAKIGNAAVEVVPKLIDIIQKPSKTRMETAPAAIKALSHIARNTIHAKEAAAVIEKQLLENYGTSSTSSAIEALGYLGADAKATIPTLVSIIKTNGNRGTSFQQREGEAAGKALSKMGFEGMAALISLLESPVEMTRFVIVLVLQNTDSPAFFAIPILEKMAKEETNFYLRLDAKRVLEKLKEQVR